MNIGVRESTMDTLLEMWDIVWSSYSDMIYWLSNAEISFNWWGEQYTYSALSVILGYGLSMVILLIVFKFLLDIVT